MRRVGIIPFHHDHGRLKVLMVTSQTRSRWVFPKGVVRRGESPIEACHREGFEEAGVRGQVLEQRPFKALVDKSVGDGTQAIPVTYFPYLVKEAANKWPERKSRRRRWFRIKDVPRVAGHDDMAAVIRKFKSIRKRIEHDLAERR